MSLKIQDLNFTIIRRNVPCGLGILVQRYWLMLNNCNYGAYLTQEEAEEAAHTLSLTLAR